jgi:hypothetical protein
MDTLRAQTSNRNFLLSIVKNDYNLPADIPPFALAQALLPNLASNDGQLRDDLTYTILTNGIIGQQKLTSEELQKLLAIVIDQNHLFWHIGESRTDTVFMRSFSNLIIAAILYSDGLKPSFSVATVNKVKEELFRYAQEEKDWRGYVEGKGWAHAMAHLADALDQCAQHPTMTKQDRQDILSMLIPLLTSGQPLYHEEDIRLATVAFHIILGKQVDDAYIQEWVQHCVVSREPDVVAWMRLTNAKNFLRSLYFLLDWNNVLPALAEDISGLLKNLDAVYLTTAPEP